MGCYHFPSPTSKDNTAEFDNDMTIADWLTGYSPVKDATYVRGFLGRMLFAGEDGVKKVRIPPVVRKFAALSR